MLNGKIKLPRLPNDEESAAKRKIGPTFEPWISNPITPLSFNFNIGEGFNVGNFRK